MVDLPAQDVRDGLHLAMRVPGEPGSVFVGNIGPEVVEQEEGVVLLRLTEPDGAMKVDAGALDRGPGLDDLADLSVLHVAPPGR